MNDRLSDAVLNSFLVLSRFTAPNSRPGIPQRRKTRHGSVERASPYLSPTSHRDVQLTSTVIRHENEYNPINDPNAGGDFTQVLRSQQPSDASIKSPRTEDSASGGAALSDMLHPSHDPMPDDESQAADSDRMGQPRGVDALCADLKVNTDVYTGL